MHISQVALLIGVLCVNSSSPVAQVERGHPATVAGPGSDVPVERVVESGSDESTAWRIDNSLCNPRVGVCENPVETSDQPTDDRRKRARDTVLCNPRVRLCDIG